MDPIVKVELNGLEQKTYSASWSKSSHRILDTSTTKLKSKKLSARTIGLNEARREFYSLCLKYGAQARELAAANLKESLKLFRDGKGWIKGNEKKYNNGQISFCAIGAIHQANGKAEHLARLAADLASGELFPERTLVVTNATNTEYTTGLGYTSVPCVNVELPNVVRFNDAESTEFKDVKLVFKRAIALLG